LHRLRGDRRASFEFNKNTLKSKEKTMKLSTLISAAAAGVIFVPSIAFADIVVQDAYARSAGSMAKAGAAFMMLENTGTTADRLIDAKSDAAAKIELHTHIDQGDGVMKMTHVPEGFDIPAGSMVALKRGGKHVMFMGLQNAWSHGDTLDLTLVFEQAGEINIQVPVDLERQDKMMHSHN
jgi:copper(I)-binding protein